jgi:hypothetical protein
MTKIANWPYSIQILYITSLVTLWVGATIANVSTVFGMSVDMMGLAGISVFIGAMLVRSYQPAAGR